MAGRSEGKCWGGETWASHSAAEREPWLPASYTDHLEQRVRELEEALREIADRPAEDRRNLGLDWIDAQNIARAALTPPPARGAPTMGEQVWVCRMCGRMGDSMNAVVAQGCEGAPELHVPAAERDSLAASNEALRGCGDTLQSSASRLGEFVRDFQQGNVPSYEIRMAALEAESAVNEWTALRSQKDREQ
jgi:hypothetical protein